VAKHDFLPIALYWHMHQPLYKDLVTERYHMPWVRLHASKDYCTMVAMLERYPSLRLTVNLVPSLLVQLEDYASGKATDTFLELSWKSAELLEPDDKEFILYNFFMANWETMVKVFPRYNDLLEKRGLHYSPARAEEVAATFTVADFRDLQVWFNLAWTNSSIRRDDEALRHLVAKGANFTEDDKAVVLNKQAEIVRSVIPRYKEAFERGQIEITTTAFYHPIMPLLCDTLLAQEARPGTSLPKVRIQYPEDVDTQIQRAVDYHQRVFGQKPDGMWPSEGAVCEQVIPLMARHGIAWTASSEEVLAASLDVDKVPEVSLRRENPPAFVYHPYRFEKNGASVAMVFRDRVLSDLIGFTYHRWPPQAAVDDLVDRLNRIRLVMATEERPYLVSIILDGENPWERYPEDGQPFLNLLYERLSSDPTFQTVSIGQFLRDNPPTKVLPKLAPGSWIGGDFDVWIGGEEENRAWDYLDEARTALVRREQRAGEPLAEENLRKAWEEIYAAEGSDWNWWYGEHHSSANDPEFDDLYRKHLRNVYQLIGLEPPQNLFTPILSRTVRPTAKPVALMAPVIDGMDSNYYEWLSAGLVDVKIAGGTARKAENIISRLYFGFDLENLYLRIDDNGLLVREMQQGTQLRVVFLQPQGKEVAVTIDGGNGARTAVLRRVNQTGSVTEGSPVPFAVGKVMEMAVPWRRLDVGPGDPIELVVVLERGGLEIERCPSRGPVTIEVPSREFELINWYV